HRARHDRKAPTWASRTTTTFPTTTRGATPSAGPAGVTMPDAGAARAPGRIHAMRQRSVNPRNAAAGATTTRMPAASAGRTTKPGTAATRADPGPVRTTGDRPAAARPGPPATISPTGLLRQP